MSSEVRKLFMKITGSGTDRSARRANTCSAMMSRKLWPGRTSSSDFARFMPIEVPRPPFSLITTVELSAARARAGSNAMSACRGRSLTGSRSASLSSPVSPAASSR